jgi:hypothetical protein
MAEIDRAHAPERHVELARPAPAVDTRPAATADARADAWADTRTAVATEHAKAVERMPTGRVDQPDLPVDQRAEFTYGRPLDATTGRPPPLFDGPPSRDQARQGELGDCGVIATMGSVAAHRPHDLTGAVTENADGSYGVRLHEARWSGPDRTEPTGQRTDLTVTPEFPVRSTAPDQSVYADQSHSGVAWPGVLEKGIAGADGSTSAGATGYERLDGGTDPWERAELLTQLTGEPAVVRPFDKTPGREAVAEAEMKDALDAGKPVIVGVPEPPAGVRLPHNLIGGHAYEVVAVDRGTVELHNPYGFDHPSPMPVRDLLDVSRDHYTTLE